MSNELVVFQPAKYPALIDGSDAHEALLANTRGAGFSENDLVRIPIPAAGATRWLVPAVTGEQMTEEIAGILVYFAFRGVLWPTQEPTQGSLPLLVSTDLITAHRVGDFYGDIDPEELDKYYLGKGLYDWRRLPWNQWNTGKAGIGKRCQESRLLLILREGESLPVLIRAQPGSLKAIAAFLVRLPVPHWRAVIGLRLHEAQSKGGIKFSRIAPRLIAQLDRETGERVRAIYTEPLQRMAEGALASDAEQGDGE